MNTDSTNLTAVTASRRLERLGHFLAIDPDNVTLLRDYGREACRIGEADAGRVAVDRLVALRADEVMDHVLVARALRHGGRTDEALQRMLAAAGRWPDGGAILLEQARCLFAAGEFEGALAVLPSDATHHEDPRFASAACELRVRLLHHLGHLDEALAAVERFRAAWGRDRFVDAAVIAVLVDLSRLDEARSIAEALIADPQDGGPPPYEVCEVMALHELSSGDRPQEALQWTGRAMALRRDDGRVWLVEGMALLRMQKLPEASQAFGRATGLMAQHPGSHLALGWARLLQGEHDAAREAFVEAQRLSPSFAEGFGSMAVLDAMLGDANSARFNLRKARLLDPECASALLAVALLEKRSGTDIARLADRVISKARAGAPGPSDH